MTISNRSSGFRLAIALTSGWLSARSLAWKKIRLVWYNHRAVVTISFTKVYNNIQFCIIYSTQKIDKTKIKITLIEETKIRLFLRANATWECWQGPVLGDYCPVCGWIFCTRVWIFFTVPIGYYDSIEGRLSDSYPIISQVWIKGRRD